MAVNAEKNQQDQQNKLNQPVSNSQGLTSGGSAGTPTGQSRVANYSSGTQAGSTGSGRFTNLSKYINANQGAGDRLASGISANIDKQNAGVSREANTQAANVRDGIEAANQKLTQGNEYLNQINDSVNKQTPQTVNAAGGVSINKPTGQNNAFQGTDGGMVTTMPVNQTINTQFGTGTFDPIAWANNPELLKSFSEFRDNQAVDPNELANQTNQAYITAQQLQNQQQQQLANASTEQGRFNLLKQAFGGGTVYQNPYSTGQQKLDQLFLQTGGANNINNIQNQVREGLNQSGQLLGDINQQYENINTLAGQAKDLSQGLRDQTSKLTNDYVASIEGKKDEINAARAQEQAWVDEQYKKLVNNEAIDQRFADMLGLTQGQHLYNSLVGKNLQDLFDLGPAQLDNFGQLANAEQENYYKALTQLAGVDPGFVLDGDAKAAVASRNTLGDILGAGTETFNAAPNDNISYTWGGGAVAPGTATISREQGIQALSGLSSDTLNKLRNAPEAVLNQFNNSNGDMTAYLASSLGISPQEAQILAGNLEKAQFQLSGPAGTGSYARLNALRNMAGLLYDQGYSNVVNIAPPSDLERGTGRIS